MADAEHLAASGMASDVLRILVEPGAEQVGSSISNAWRLVDEIHATLDTRLHACNTPMAP